MSDVKRSGVKRSDILFCYDAKNCIPNGDPNTGEQRYDCVTGKIQVSDVRIKRYSRDNIIMVNAFSPGLKTDGIYMRDVDLKFLKSQDVKFTDMSGSAAQVKVLSLLFKDDPEIIAMLESNKSSKGKKSKKNSEGEEPIIEITLDRTVVEALIKRCIDVRVYGGVTTGTGNNVALTGPLQFNMMNSSLHRVELETLQNTSVFQSDTKKGQGSIGTTSIVPYAFICINGATNPLIANETEATERDIMFILKNTWHGLNSYRSRSKMGQTSRLLVKINYKDPRTHVADMDEAIQIKDPDSISYRSINDLTFNFSRLLSLAQRDIVDSIEYAVEAKLKDAFLFQMAPVSAKLVEFQL